MSAPDNVITLLRWGFDEPATADASIIWAAPSKPTQPAKRPAPKSASKPRGGYAHHYSQFAQSLQARPGEWAVLVEYTADAKALAHRKVNRITSGRIAALRDGFEACSETEGGTARVYVRFVGKAVSV